MQNSLKLKISYKGLFIFIIAELGLLLILQYLGERYSIWGIDYKSVFSFLSIAFISMSKILYDLFSKEGTILTPITLYCIFILLFGFSFLKINESNISLSTISILVLIISIVFFLSGICLGVYSKTKYRILCNISGGVYVLKCLVWVSLIVFLLECLLLGYIPILNFFSTNVYGESNENAIPILHYFVQLANVIPIWLYVLYKESIISKRVLIKYSAITIFIAINSLSRQGWLLSMLCFCIAYNYYNTISRKSIVIAVFSFLFLFGIIGTIRAMTIITSDISELEYMQGYAGTKYDTNLVETYLGIYSTNNFTTFDSFINNAKEENYLAFGAYMFRPIYSLLFLNKLDFFAINEKYDSLLSLGTYAIEPYLDFGIVGVIVLNLIYGFVAGRSYKMYKLKKCKYIIPWGIMAYCIIMSSFTNYYNTLFVWLIFFFNYLIMSSKSYDQKHI